MSPCWHRLFARTSPCPLPGLYGVIRPDGSLPLMRWCERHKFEQDVLLPAEVVRAEQLQLSDGGVM
jgi:hypothetical protein